MRVSAPRHNSSWQPARSSRRPTAESEVAISFSGWAASFCPHCGSHHRKVTYAFLSSEPVSCSVAKASADHQWSARAIVMTPPCYYRTILEQTTAFSVTPGEESFHTVQPSAVCTSDFRPLSQARHLHCRRHHIPAACLQTTDNTTVQPRVPALRHISNWQPARPERAGPHPLWSPGPPHVSPTR